MINIQMTNDIRKFEPTFLGPFTKRECICLLIGILYSLPITTLLPLEGWAMKLIVFCFLIAPAFACGRIKYNGSHLETIVIHIIYLYFLTPQKRKIVRSNTWKESYKKYLKQKNKNQPKSKPQKVVYSQKKEYTIYK